MIDPLSERGDKQVCACVRACVRACVCVCVCVYIYIYIYIYIYRERERLIIKAASGLLGLIWTWASGQCSLSNQVLWDCAQGCWEHIALIGVYRLVWLELGFAFHQRDTWTSPVGSNSGSVPIALVCFGYSVQEASVSVNGSFLSAESILGRRKRFHFYGGGYPYGGPALGLTFCQGLCVPLTHKHAGQVTATTCVRTLWLCEGHWAAQGHTILGFLLCLPSLSCLLLITVTRLTNMCPCIQCQTACTLAHMPHYGAPWLNPLLFLLEQRLYIKIAIKLFTIHLPAFALCSDHLLLSALEGMIGGWVWPRHFGISKLSVAGP
jgi:hypothetical protein